MIGPLYDQYGFSDWNFDEHVTTLLKTQIRKWACHVDIDDCRERALEKFNREVKNPKFVISLRRFYYIISQYTYSKTRL